jgi:hypothetical protein
MEAKILKATHEGPIEIGGFEIKSYNLDNGERVLSRIDFLRALGRTGKAKGGRAYDAEFKLPVFLTAKNLKPYVNKDLIENSKPVIFKDLKGVQSIGYKAELLPSVCYVFMDAAEKSELHQNQIHIVQKCKILVRGFATIGIIALIDQATGYQEVRDRQALQKILDKYITDEWAKWTKTFSDEFYQQLFRLKNMPYPPLTKNKPSYIGHWTNDLVYKRLAPGVLKALREVDPKLPSGNRARRFHQHLTTDYGNPELKKHIDNLIFLMKGCTTWTDFTRKLNRASPKHGDTIPMDFPNQKDEGDE